MNEICSKTFIDMFVNYVQKKKKQFKTVYESPN